MKKVLDNSRNICYSCRIKSETEIDMTDFEFKLEKFYKTAYSPLFETFVGIRKVRKDDRGEYIVDAHVAGTPKDDIHLFRVHELERFCL